MRDCCS